LISGLATRAYSLGAASRKNRVTVCYERWPTSAHEWPPFCTADDWCLVTREAIPIRTFCAPWIMRLRTGPAWRGLSCHRALAIRIYRMCMVTGSRIPDCGRALA